MTPHEWVRIWIAPGWILLYISMVVEIGCFELVTDVGLESGDSIDGEQNIILHFIAFRNDPP